jgi:hypothetical protein
MTETTQSGGWRGVVRHVAFRALARSVSINMAAPAIIYRWATSHFATGSLVPLGLSAAPPVAALAYSLWKLKAIDFLGLFAVENVVVSIASLLLAHTEQGALIGRSLQNVPLAAIFLASLVFRKPLVLYMARQLATGNDPTSASRFDQAADEPKTLAVYRLMTCMWTAGLLVKSAGSVYLALTFVAKDFLIASPLWDLVTDGALVGWSIVYGRAKLTDLTRVPAGPVADALMVDA